MKYLVIIVSKILSFIGKILKRGSSLPGYLALKMDSKILSRLDLSDDVIIVTGTNGKTSTTKYIAHVLSENGFSVTSNASGANMPQGITTEILKNVSLSGKLKTDYLVLEVDEAYVKEINHNVKAKYLVVTNLFKDQVDRFPNVNIVKNIILEGIVKENILVLNADDPYTRHLADLCDNDILYFGFNNIIDEAISKNQKCPNCENDLTYDSNTYNHLGHYHCECGFKRPQHLKYQVSAYDAHTHSIIINDYNYTLNNVALYNAYNYLATIAVLRELNISEENINKVMAHAVVGRGRMETFESRGLECFINLVKNEAGLNQTLSYINLLDQKQYDILISIHSRVPDGPNIEWLRGISIDDLNKEEVSKIIVTGDEAKRVYELFLEIGVSKDRLVLIEDLDEAVKTTLESLEVPTYFLANYTSLPAVRQAVFK